MLCLKLLKYNHGKSDLANRIACAFAFKEEDLDKETLFELNETSQNQYQVIKIIADENNFNIPVIVENNPTVEHDPASELLIRTAFPGGIPAKFEALTFDQKVCIVTLGVSRFLVNSHYMLHYIKNVNI